VRPHYAPAEQTALFTGKNGTRLSPRQVEKRLERWAQQRGIGMQVHPHMLRHSFASHVLQSSGDLRAVQDMLGHASIAATQIYTHLDFQHLAKIYDTAHPRAKKV
jgi:integrase/recombinase XerC